MRANINVEWVDIDEGIKYYGIEETVTTESIQIMHTILIT